MYCDVIIPIYNAYDAVKECVASVIAGTDLHKNGLILIDDRSPDERIWPLLQQFKAAYPDINLTILQNEENKGFVGTVNRGMRLAKEDVVLLNSDTVVGKNWLEKMKKCAYSQERVGTVTALSNNATLVSVPDPLKRNEAPDLSIDEYNEIIEKCSYREYPQIPTCHGFCVYILREALNTVGYFDEEHFGKGYGEENDFSYRCTEHGLCHLVCDDTLVYHHESLSFTNTKSIVAQEHEAYINKIYPHLHRSLHIWLANFPMHHICKNIAYATELHNRKNVLILVHDWTTEIGGTTLHIKDLIEKMRDQYNFHVLAPDAVGYNLFSYFKQTENVIHFPMYLYGCKYSTYHQDYKRLVDNILKAFRINILHVHHMMNHFFDVIDAARENNVYSVITLHDYYCLCPTVTLLYEKKQYCMDLENKDCGHCLKSQGYVAGNIIENWRKVYNDFLLKFDSVIVPSSDLKNRIQAVMPNLDITPIEHGIKSSKSSYQPSPTNKEFNVAFIGAVCTHKGSDNIEQLIKMGRNSSIHFHTFGFSEVPYLAKNHRNYQAHGVYKREKLSALLQQNRIHLICFLNTCPETYSYTLDEAVSSNIPVLSLDMGAGPHRVRSHGLGWVLPANSTPEDIFQKIKHIAANNQEYTQVVESVSKHQLKTVSEMAEQYLSLYSAHRNADLEPDYEVLRQIINLAFNDVAIFGIL